jgi:hypothetical protein
VYAQGALRADREGWVAQARKPSREETLWVGCSGLSVGAQRLDPGMRWNRTPWCPSVHGMSPEGQWCYSAAAGAEVLRLKPEAIATPASAAMTN